MQPSHAGPMATLPRPALPGSGTTNWARFFDGMDSVWLNTADRRYFNYIKSSVDALLAPDGSIPTLKPEEKQLDNILLGRQLLLLYGVTQEKRYLTAATFLYQTSSANNRARPRVASGTSNDIPIKCGSTASIWPSPFTPSTLQSHITRMTSKTSPISFSSSSSTRAIPGPASSITAGTNRSRSVGPTSRPATLRNSGDGPLAGT